MAKPYSMDLRERALARVQASESVRSVAGALSIRASSVVKWSQRFRATAAHCSACVKSAKIVHQRPTSHHGAPPPAKTPTTQTRTAIKATKPATLKPFVTNPGWLADVAETYVRSAGREMLVTMKPTRGYPTPLTQHLGRVKGPTQRRCCPVHKYSSSPKSTSASFWGSYW